jgi:broad specificity phosphatase PhoE
MQEQEAKGLPPAPAIPTMPSMARWKAPHEQARAALDTMQEEMQGYFDDRSEAWQEGEKGEAFQEILDRVEEARTAVEDLPLE